MEDFKTFLNLEVSLSASPGFSAFINRHVCPDDESVLVQNYELRTSMLPDVISVRVQTESFSYYFLFTGEDREVAYQFRYMLNDDILYFSKYLLNDVPDMNSLH